MDNGATLKGVLEKVAVRTSRPSGVQGGYMREKGQWSTYYEAGTHAEVLAVDKALKARDWHNAQNGLPPVTVDDLNSFTTHVVHTGTADAFPKCNHCAHILDGVVTTPAMKAATARERTVGIGGTSSDPNRPVAGTSQGGSGFLDNATRLPDNLPDNLQTRRPMQQQPRECGAACAANVLRAGGDGTATPDSVGEELVKLRRARGEPNPDAKNMTLGELDELLRARNVESNVRPVGNGDPNATGVGKAPTLAQTLAEANEAGRRVLVRIEDSDGTPHIVEVVGTYETFDGKTVAVVNDTATTAPHRGQYGIDVDDLQRHATDTVQPLRPGETAEHPLARDNPRATEQVEGLAPREQAREQPRERAGTPPGQTPPPETVGQRARREAVEGVAIGTATELATCIAEGLPVQACVERAAGQVPQAAICGAAGGVSGALGIACTAANAAASCMAAGLSPKRCLEEAAPGMPPAAFCMAAGAFNPALGAICGAVAPAAWQAGVAVWEEQAVHRERQTLIDRNDANAASFNSRVGGLEGRIRQFESATGPVVEACLALRAAIGEVERLALQRRTAICQPASSAGGPAGSTAAVFAAADRARAAAARSRQLEQRLATDRAGLMGEINGMRQSYSRTPMMIDLVAQYETRLLVATCAMSEIDGASKRLDQAAALAVAPGAAGACPGTRMDAALGTGRGTAAAPAVPGEPCNIYVLNLSGAQVWVGTESERLQKKACSYALGSDNCSVLAPLIKKVSSHRTCSAATEAWCRDFNGTPVRAGYWSTRWNVYGEWVTTENAPDCPDAKHSPAALATATAPPPPPAAPPPATVSPAMPPVLGTAPSATRPATPGPTTLGVPPTTPTAPQTRPVPPPPTLGAAPPTTPAPTTLGSPSTTPTAPQTRPVPPPPTLGVAPPATPAPTTLGVPPATSTAPQTRPVPPPPTLGAAPPTTPAPTTLGSPSTTPTAPQTRPVPPPPTLGAAPPTTPAPTTLGSPSTTPTTPQTRPVPPPPTLGVAPPATPGPTTLGSPSTTPTTPQTRPVPPPPTLGVAPPATPAPTTLGSPSTTPAPPPTRPTTPGSLPLGAPPPPIAVAPQPTAPATPPTRPASPGSTPLGAPQRQPPPVAVVPQPATPAAPAPPAAPAAPPSQPVRPGLLGVPMDSGPSPSR